MLLYRLQAVRPRRESIGYPQDVGEEAFGGLIVTQESKLDSKAAERFSEVRPKQNLYSAI